MRQPKKEALARAAAGLYAKRGPVGVSVGDICAAARCSKSTFYYHFPSKEALELHLVSFDRIAAARPAATQGLGPVDALLGVSASFIDYLTGLGPAFLAHTFSLRLASGSESYFFSRDYHETGRVLVPHIRRCQGLGLITARGDAESLARIEVFTTSQLTFIWSCAGGNFDLRGEVRRHLVQLYGVVGAQQTS